MTRLMITIAIVGLLTACGNGNEGATASDSTSNINTNVPPSTVDTSMMGRMMGDTTKIMGDSTK